MYLIIIKNHKHNHTFLHSIQISSQRNETKRNVPYNTCTCGTNIIINEDRNDGKDDFRKRASERWNWNEMW